MKTLSVAALLACAFCNSAWAADHAKLLIDAPSNLATANWKVTSADWGEKGGPAWSVELKTLHGGRQEGVQVIDVDNGAMKFTIVPTRGFEIWKASARSKCRHPNGFVCTSSRQRRRSAGESCCAFSKQATA